MKRPRPYIPLSVRVQVAERQTDKFGAIWLVYVATAWRNRADRLAYLLTGMFPEGCHLDHDPALILRKFNPRTGKYTPDANDPHYLVYREKADHQQKTTGRKPGAAKTATTKGSDIWLKTKFNRLEGRTKKKRKQKIPARKNPWPSRPFARSTRKF